MATLVAHNNPSILSASAGIQGVNKRYRPAPAKTFQCRGYGECRMVFSRSEHLARHIRKHTGERPFTCHCSKQFSRLDNLRQHAQTVHADKQEQNERMMRELTSLHASMAAANKTGQPRGKRGQASVNAAAVLAASNHSGSQDSAMHGLDQVKEEDLSASLHPMHQRPGTSTGYEGGDNMIYGDGWNSDLDRGGNINPRPTNNHSFRDSSQSFRVPPASSTSWQQQSQSFQTFTTNTFNFSIPSRDGLSRDGRPGSSSSRPPTAGGPDAHARTLPPLAAVVSATISPPSSQSFAIPPQSAQHVLPLPFRRPSTANRPGTAPASILSTKPAYAGGPGLVTELSVPVYGRGDMAAPSSYGSVSYDPEPASPTGGSYDSPFSFHPPALADPVSSGGPFAYSPPSNPRKRPYPGPDDDVPRREPSSGLSGPGEYEYGSESRPQSRRLTVLELCNDPDADAGIRSFLPGATGSASRPTTASGLISSASTLTLVDRTPISSYTLLPGAQTPTASAAAAAAYSASTASLGGGRVSPQFRHDISSASAAAAAGSLLSASRGNFASSPLSDTSRSPRSQPHGVAFATVARSVSIQSNSSSPSSNGATPPALSRRGRESPASSPYSSSAVGMKV
ncbi:hypothetical protein DEU56DRAFT_738532 [Suillus clintonianus]|uniref:uncharacterized protein n=1 Tax=Suillus clintonianus TaxID=1904413 RepID=UPI001B87989D|nr:uncharacterized protein DEU56DRAFT_738532 [Suillus clintonianus]KAG2134492.1 hypothetical protein DEU56DRAFT_738532 [Suillus clintonianus]